jgi:hypothetical protein
LWIQSEGFELSAPFRGSIAKSRDTDAARQTTFDCCFDEVRCQERERDGHIDLSHAPIGKEQPPAACHSRKTAKAVTATDTCHQAGLFTPAGFSLSSAAGTKYVSKSDVAISRVTQGRCSRRIL